MTGRFVDAAVTNIAYRTATQTGFTNATGEFTYLEGESVIFSIGGIDFPGTRARAVVTPMNFTTTGEINHPVVLNALRLLQSLDIDGNPGNGIQIGDAAHVAARDMSLLFDSLNFESDVSNLIVNSGSINSVLVTADSAKAHFLESLASLGAKPLLPVSTDVSFIYNGNGQSVRFLDSRSIAGTILSPLMHPTGAQEYFHSDSEVLRYYGFYSPLVIVTGSGTYTADVVFHDPVTLLRKQWPATGYSTYVSGRGQATISPAYGVRSITYTGYVHYYGIENVITGVGTLPAKHIGYSLTVSATIDGVVFSVPVQTGLWINDKAGIIKRVDNGQTFLLSSLTGPDRDQDNVIDFLDAFPDDPAESQDNDHDGIGDRQDQDDDNDGYPDTNDAFPKDISEAFDNDGDLIGDNADLDDDNDGYQDTVDHYPLDPLRHEALSVSNQSLSYIKVLGSSVQAGGQLAIRGANLNWSVSASDPWIMLDRNVGIGNANLGVTINASALAPGNHRGSLVLINEHDGDRITIDVTVDVVLPTFTVSTSSVILDNSGGWNNTSQSLDLSLNTGTNNYPLTASVTHSHASSLGVYSAGSVSSSPVAVSVAVHDPGAFSEGRHSGTITFRATVLGWPVEATVNMDVIASEQLIYVPDNGVALTSFPNASVLSKTVIVKNSYGINTTAWTATSNSSWLTVTASGVTEGELTLIADPSGLATDTLHLAEVVVAADNPSIENTETIHVGLWVGSQNPVSRTFNVNITYVETDPVRPYAYVHGANASDISIYNIYQGNIIGVISGIGTNLGDMKVSSDGQTLYVVDNGTMQVVRVDLNDYAARSAWTITQPLYYGFELVRNKGREFLIAEYGTMYYPDTGVAVIASAFSSGYYGRLTIDASLFGNRFCGINSGLSPFSIYCYDIAYNSYTNEMTLTSLGGVPHGTGSNGRDIALSSDGSSIYIASGAPYAFIVVDAATMSFSRYLTADAYPTAIDVDDDNVIHGGAAVHYGPLDVWVYRPDGTLRNSAYASGYARTIRPRQVVPSGDGRMTIVATEDPRLSIVSGY